MVGTDTPLRITVIGAGVVGCYLGGRLARHADVTLVGRPHVLDPIRAVGLTVESGEGVEDRLHVPAEALTLAETPVAVRRSDVVLVCTKAGSTASATAEFVPYLRPGSLVVGLQNGLHSADLIREGVDATPVIAGIIPFNVARTGPATYRRTSTGEIRIAEHPLAAPLLRVMEEADLRVRATDDIQAVLHGKVLLNMNNAVQALSGLPLRTELLDRDLRRCVALCQAEANRVFTAAGVVSRVPIAVPAGMLPAVMRLPTPVFRRLARAVMRVDADGTSSMNDDLVRGRPTEIDILQGEVVRMGRYLGVETPACAHMVELVHEAERAGPDRRQWTGKALLAELQRARRRARRLARLQL
ncbi:MAG: 2-dehydropantoate 2-reductase [Dietzia sp.]|uniref:2-dehydropantoate 2-reductase n=1 Tax=unclassified Dietzia TaxID=2617939 RepID=UPI0015FC3A3C|nr:MULTISPECIES: 2-dehydropantoate 2-reductase [unclassified Dietzia]MBB1040909.1 2-dehydropantoate 2-reductase [Dietzia sp. Cai40]MBB1043358.1 2-dehydropantoate 2-reductase [Dietzia sp. DQ11-44]MBB1050851.1 2-dehydropantoate 2-reductase [Dietzia sp. CW19]MBB1054682.1 2-dehydropantoate 2-reductase [Dietzia sp. B44]MBB1058179.1 2-dehydropantoate 2-reductase [Dietzia sp. B19]